MPIKRRTLRSKKVHRSNKRNKNRHRRTNKKPQYGGGCGCDTKPLFKGGNASQYVQQQTPNTYALNTYNNPPITLSSTNMLKGGQNKRSRRMKGGNPQLLGVSAADPYTSLKLLYGAPVVNGSITSQPVANLVNDYHKVLV